MKSADRKDYNRYMEHIKTLSRALEIMRSDESPIIKQFLLNEIHCDRQTYGDVQNGQVHPIPEGKSHKEVIEAEIRSFRHAMEMLQIKTKKEKNR